MVIIPSSYSHALDELFDKDLMIIAGGTDVMVRNRNWSGLSPKLNKDILSIASLKELSYIKEDDRGLHIGANTSLETILKSQLVCPLLREAIGQMASPAIRHVGTIGGNIGNASPAGDTLPILYIYDTIVVLESVEGIRELSISEFITGPGKHIRKPDELIKEIILKDLEVTGYYYEKVGGRRSDAISKLSFGGTYVQDDEGRIIDIRLAFGAVYKTVIRNRNLELSLMDALNKEKAINASLPGKSNVIASINEKVVKELVESYEVLIQPIDDQRSSAAYRKACAVNLLKSFIQTLGGDHD